MIGKYWALYGLINFVIIIYGCTYLITSIVKKILKFIKRLKKRRKNSK